MYKCQFDILLSINGFLSIIEFILTKYPGSKIQARRLSQDMLEGLFGTIRELGGDSSTQTLQGYGYAINKYQITAIMTSEIQSHNYGSTTHNGMGLIHLKRRHNYLIYFLSFYYSVIIFNVFLI